MTRRSPSYVDTREEVDAAYRRCLEIGARIHFPPEDDRDIEGYNELFVFDPDGLTADVHVVATLNLRADAWHDSPQSAHPERHC